MSKKPEYDLAPDGQLALVNRLHSREKLHYVHRYIDQFLVATKSKFKIRNYVDLMCGPGICKFEDGQGFADSSALYALKHKDLFTHYYFNDLHTDSIGALSVRAKQLDLTTRCSFENLDCNEAGEKFVSMIKKQKSMQLALNLVLIDGFGIECKWNTVHQIASLRKVDFIILFPAQMNIVRNAERWSNEDDPDIDKYMPDKHWRNEWKRTRLSNQPSAYYLCKIYMNGLSKLGYPYAQETAIKAEGGAPLYYLISASSHPLSEKFWKNAVSKDDEGQIRLIP